MQAEHAAAAALKGQKQKSLLLLKPDNPGGEADHIPLLIFDFPEILGLELQHLRHAFTSTGW